MKKKTKRGGREGSEEGGKEVMERIMRAKRDGKDV